MITSASLALYSTMDGQVGSQVALGVTCVSRDWDQKTVNWNRASSTVNWTSPGVDNLASPVIKSSRANQFINQWETITVTDHVKKWVADRSSNFGFKLALDDGGVEWIDWASSEYAAIANRPKLTIAYTSNTGPVPVQRVTTRPSITTSTATKGSAYTLQGTLISREGHSHSPATGVHIRQTGSTVQSVNVHLSR